jgi:hypothetical protein
MLYRLTTYREGGLVDLAAGGRAQAQSGAASPDSQLVRFVGVLRDITRGGLAGLIAGVLVGGLGGRLVMTGAALLNRDAFGRLTENGEVIGVFSVPGTLALLLFGGLSAGLLGAVVWVVVSPWLPWRGPRRWLLMMPIAIALGAFILVESTNSDFTTLQSIEVILAMLFVLVAVNGAAIAWLDEILERRIPGPSTAPRVGVAVYGLFAALGAVPLLLTQRAYLDEDFSTAPTPPFVGAALLVVGAATLAWWAMRVVGRTAGARPELVLIGRGALIAAVAAGALNMAAEVARILGR